MHRIYLALAVIGAIVPWVFFFGFFRDAGLGAATFVSALFANNAASGAFADLAISSLVFWVLMGTTRNGPPSWPFVALNLLVGLSCALPAWLYVRERGRENGSA